VNIVYRAIVAIGLIAGLSVLGADAHAGPKQDIIGKWTGDRGATIEFQADGKLAVTVRKIPRPGSNAKPETKTATGSYAWVDDASLTVELKLGGEIKKDTLKIKLDGDTLTTTDSRGTIETLKRTK